MRGRSVEPKEAWDSRLSILNELHIGQEELPEIGMLESVTRELQSEDWKTEEKEEEQSNSLFPKLE